MQQWINEGCTQSPGPVTEFGQVPVSICATSSCPSHSWAPMPGTHHIHCSNGAAGWTQLTTWTTFTPTCCLQWSQGGTVAQPLVWYTRGQPAAANTVLSKCPLSVGSSCIQLQGHNPDGALKCKVSLSPYHHCQAPVKVELVPNTHREQGWTHRGVTGNTAALQGTASRWGYTTLLLLSIYLALTTLSLLLSSVMPTPIFLSKGNAFTPCEVQKPCPVVLSFTQSVHKVIKEE